MENDKEPKDTIISAMDRTLNEHIAHLERKIVELRRKLADTRRTESEKIVITIDLGIAERAITHYRKALELENKISD